jgi:hypothetical protein
VADELELAWEHGDKPFHGRFWLPHSELAQLRALIVPSFDSPHGMLATFGDLRWDQYSQWGKPQDTLMWLGKIGTRGR